jgi:hypothetical protein
LALAKPTGGTAYRRYSLPEVIEYRGKENQDI